MLAETWGPGQVAYSILWFSLFLIEIWLMFTVFIDIFRSDDLSGWAKALWVIFVLVLPLVGVLVCLVVRGNQMRVHAARELRQQDEVMRRSILGVVGSQPSPGDELMRLAELRDRGDITADEYRRLKARVVGGEPVAA